MLKNMLSIILQYKKISSLVALLLVGIGVYFLAFRGSATMTSYVLAKVEKGTIIVSVEGTGQVVASDQVDVKPKTSGDVTYVAVKAGQKVSAGMLLVQLDTSSAVTAVRDAQIALESAEISLAKLRINQQSNIPDLEDAITQAKSDLIQAYQNGYNKVADAFLQTPDILAGTRGIIYDSTVGSANQQNSGAYQDLVSNSMTSTIYTMVHRAMADYASAEKLHIENLAAYQGSYINDTPEQIVTLMDGTLETARAMVQAARDEQNILDTVESDLHQHSRSVPKTITQYQADLGSYISTLNSVISGMTSIHTTITSSKGAITTAQRSLTEAQMSNPLDLKSQENVVEQRRASLVDAQTALANCSVRAPLSGIVTNVAVKKGDTASTGTTVGTLVTQQRVAEVSLNEVDVANIKVGQKATLTFDAIENLTMTGTVAEVATIGTTSQGVVSYDVKISFDVHDERIKPSMSVSAAIITATKQDVLVVASSALKTSNAISYVQVPTNQEEAIASLASATVRTAGVALSSAPSRRTVEVGLASDALSEITSGLSEGDVIIARTITSTTSTTTTQTKASQGGNFLQGGGMGPGR
jgi:HlyD family secretion protein